MRDFKTLSGLMMVSLAVCASGCVTEGPLAPMREPYRPGETVLLRWNPEMSYSNGGGQNLEWGKVEMPVTVQSLGDGNGPLLEVRTRRVISGYDFTGENGRKQNEVADSDETKGAFRVVSLSIRMDSAGHLAAVNAPGGAVDLGRVMWTRTEEVGDYLNSHGFSVIYPALAQSLAYVPPAGAAVGRAWTVRRENVALGHDYGYYMMTGGAMSAKEESLCRCDRVEPTGAGRIAVIAITGTRVPQYPREGPKRVSSLSVVGELRYNLDTGRIDRLRIESLPQWSDPNDAKQWQTKFVDTLSTEDLKP